MYKTGVGMNAVPGGHFPLPSSLANLLSLLPPPQCFQVNAISGSTSRIVTITSEQIITISLFAFDLKASTYADKVSSISLSIGPFCTSRSIDRYDCSQLNTRDI